MTSDREPFDEATKPWERPPLKLPDGVNWGAAIQRLVADRLPAVELTVQIRPSDDWITLWKSDV